jgi:hypothetical protein
MFQSIVLPPSSGSKSKPSNQHRASSEQSEVYVWRTSSRYRPECELGAAQIKAQRKATTCAVPEKNCAVRRSERLEMKLIMGGRDFRQCDRG